MINYPGWPYAAKSVIQHEFDTDHLNIWLTFRFGMNQLVMPNLSKWTVKVDDTVKAVAASDWQDAFTLLLTVPTVSALPDRVLVSYAGPGPTVYLPTNPNRKTLEISRNKQYEPWTEILSLNVTT